MLARSKRPRGTSLTLLLTVAFLCIVWPKPAHAYIDPAVGSMILQAVLATIIGVGVYFRDLRLKITSLFRRQRSDEAEPD